MTGHPVALLLSLAFVVASALVAPSPTARAATAATVAACVGSIGPSLPPPATLPEKRAGFHAAWYGQSGYPTLCPGETASAVVAYYNSGHIGWVSGRMGEVAYLGTWGPEPGQDRASALGGDGTNGSPATKWPRYNRVAIQPADYVGPGQVAWFQFTIQAPTKPGIYFLGLRPLIEGATWLEDYGVFWFVTVLNPDGSHPGFRCEQCWALSGQPVGGGPTTRRPLSVKIDNAPAARPHSGITSADMVWEFLVEGGITRLNAIFHAKDADVVGAVRSGRLSDRYLTQGIRGAFAYSGATIEELAFFREDVRAGKYVDVGAATGAGNSYYRVGYRPSPYNLFTSTRSLRAALPIVGGADPVDVPRWDFVIPLGDFGLEKTGLNGSIPARALTIPYRSFATVRYEYDPATKTYARWQAGVREVDAANDRPIAARNVVVIGTEVWETNIVEDIFGSKGVDMRMTGTGPASVFRDGRRQDGTWSRPTQNDPFTFTNLYGERILLSPGQTWLHVVPKDWVISSSQ